MLVETVWVELAALVAAKEEVGLNVSKVPDDEAVLDCTVTRVEGTPSEDDWGSV